MLTPQILNAAIDPFVAAGATDQQITAAQKRRARSHWLCVLEATTRFDEDPTHDLSRNKPEHFAYADRGRGEGGCAGGPHSNVPDYWGHGFGRGKYFDGGLATRISPPVSPGAYSALLPQLEAEASSLVAAQSSWMGAARFGASRWLVQAAAVPGGRFVESRRLFTAADTPGTMTIDSAGTWRVELLGNVRSANPAVSPTVSVQLWIGGSLATTWSATRPAAPLDEDGNPTMPEQSVLTPFDVSHVAVTGGAATVELRATGSHHAWLDALVRVYQP